MEKVSGGTRGNGTGNPQKRDGEPAETGRGTRGNGTGIRGNGTGMKKSYGVNFSLFFFFEINAGLITFADVFVYEQFGDMINILHEMCV